MKPTLHHPLKAFLHATKTNRLFVDLARKFPQTARRKVQDAESASWAGSLPRLCDVLELAPLSDSVEVAVEIGVPYYGKRIDAALFGHNKAGDPCMVLVELKQWSKLNPPDEDGRLYIWMRSGRKEVEHPSQQVHDYQQYLSTFLRACRNEPRVKLVSCAYAHNYPDRTGPLFDAQFAQDIERSPLFSACDAELFASFIKKHVGAGGGAEILQRIWREGCGPSLALKDHASDLVYSQNVFTLLDEQILARNSIITAVKRAKRAGGKSIILIEGGPGTGKSLIALDAFGELHTKHEVSLVSGSAALTGGWRRLLGNQLARNIHFTDYFWQHPENSVDIMIVDEAHRIRDKSRPRVPAPLRPTISQLEELVRTARVLVLFMDVNQIIDPSEAGDPEKVEQLAETLGIRFERHELRSQFRCDGSDEYLLWCDDLFELRESDDPQLLSTPTAFDFQVLDSPQELLAWVQAQNTATRDCARFVAGWCWPWSDPEEDGTLVNDIRIGDFAFPWELKNDKDAGPDIPQARHWAINPAGAGQAGTVYSIQGYEFPHIAVLMGPDLVIRNGRWLAAPNANYKDGLKTQPPEVASIYFRRIYRTLFTRALLSTRVYSVDPETREFLCSKLNPRSRHP